MKRVASEDSLSGSMVDGYDDRKYNEAKYIAVQRQFRVKQLTIYRNGDPYFPPKRYILNHKQTPTMDVLLQQITELVKPKSGYIQRIYTPKMGHRVQSLDDIHSGSAYVAAAKSERFYPLPYNYIRELPPIRVGELKKPRIYDQPATEKRTKIVPKTPDADPNAIVPSMPLNVQPKSIHVFKNGDAFSGALSVLLKPHEQQDWLTVLNAISEKVKLANTLAIRKLFRMDGMRVAHVDEIENGGYYVAASREMFIPASYGRGVVRMQLASVVKPRMQPFLHKPPTPVEARPEYKHTVTNNSSREFYQREFLSQNKRQVYDENGFINKPVRFTKYREDENADYASEEEYERPKSTRRRPVETEEPQERPANRHKPKRK